MSQLINRVDHVVWLVQPQNLEAYVEKFSKLFRTQFDGPQLRPAFGVKFWVSWEAGLEILAPWGDNDSAKMWTQRLKDRGEGVFSVVFGVRDLEEASEHARQLGYPVSPVFSLSGDEPWKHKMESFQEVVIGDMLGTLMGFGEIRYAEGVVEKE